MPPFAPIASRAEPVAVASPRPSGVEYPEYAPKVPETEHHHRVIRYVEHALAVHFRDREDVHWGGDLLMFYREGDRETSVAPDVFVTPGMDRGVRRNYLVWEEGPPDFVLEVLSDATAKKNEDEKLGIYREIGVREYWLFDVRERHRRPRLEGHRLAGGGWLPATVGPDGVARSAALGLDLREDGDWLWLRDSRTGLDIPTAEGNERLRRLAETRVELAEAEIARLRALLEAQQDPG